MITIPELSAAIDHTHAWMPFTTISEMTGHLERHHNTVELAVVAAIVFIVFSLVRMPPHTWSGKQGPVDDPTKAQRSAGGRLTVVPRDVHPSTFEDDQAPMWFAIAAGLSLLLIGLGTWAAAQWWQDGSHFHPAYVLYGSLFLVWLVVPGLYAFFSGKDEFPTLFRSVWNLDGWLQRQSWTVAGFGVGPLLGWLLVFVVLAGLTILLLHLTLYPYPDITKVLNPNG